MNSVSFVELQAIKFCDVPAFLHHSAFYSSLNTNEPDNTIQRPRKCFKSNTWVQNCDDFALLLRTAILWGVDDIPVPVLDFCAKTEMHRWSRITAALPDHGVLHQTLTSYFRDCAHFSAAIVSGRPELVDHWLQCNSPQSLHGYDAVKYAAQAGDIALLVRLHLSGYPWSDGSCVAAARGGHLECLQYLVEHGCVCDEECCEVTARGGHLDCLQYLHEQGCPWDDESITASAAQGGHLDCLKYLHAQGCMLTRDITLSPDLECLRYGLENECVSYGGACYNSVCDTEAPLERLALLRQYDAPWNEIVADAALRRDIEYFVYLMQSGCPYNEDIVLHAAELNLLPHLQFLVEDMLLVVDEGVYSAALMAGSVECALYLVDVGCPCDFELPRAYEHDAQNSTYNDARLLKCLEYVLGHGWEHGIDLMDFVFNNNLPLCQAFMEADGWSMLNEW